MRRERGVRGGGRARARRCPGVRGASLTSLGCSSRLPSARPHQVPGVAGALSGLGVPAAPLEGQHHVPAPVGVEHGVSGWDPDVEELGGAAGLLCAHQVREHVVACVRGVQTGENRYFLRPSFSRAKRQMFSASSTSSSVAFFLICQVVVIINIINISPLPSQSTSNRSFPLPSIVVG